MAVRRAAGRRGRRTVAGLAGALAVTACDPNGTTTTETPPATSHQVQVAIAGDGVGTVSVGSTTLSCTTGGGTCAAPVPSGTLLSLTATPAAGSTFSGWAGGASTCGTASTCAIRVDTPQALTATFVRTAPVTHALTIATAGTGAGSVASAPTGIACARAAGGLQSGACEAPFTAAATVTLTATPTVGSTFVGWSGPGVIGCAGTGPCTLVVSAAQTVTATFAPSAPTTATLTVATGGAGSGTVTSAPAGLACARAADGTQGGACSAPFGVGTAVTLTASPTQGSAFVGWSGTGAASCGGTGPCTVTIAEGGTVVATFAPPAPTLYALAVATAGAGEGSVTSSPAGIQCTRTAGGQTGDCGTSVVSGTTVTLTATPSAGSTFAGWSGAGCAGTDPCTVTLQQGATVTATFAGARQTLTVATAGVGGGTVTSSPAGISCTRASGGQGGSCAASYVSGTTVTLTATPAAVSTFAGWAGACGGTGPCVVSMIATLSVTATFTSTPVPAPVALSVTTAGAGSGTVSSAPAGIACTRSGGAQGGTCGTTYASGTTVTLTAAPAAGSTFAGWSGGGCSGTGTCVVSLGAAQTVTATFGVPTPQATLSVAFSGTGAGTITSSPAGVSCTRAANGAVSGSCSASFDVGTTVTLAATPTTPGNFFNIWSGGCNFLPQTCTVTMSAAQSATVMFTADLAAPSLTVSGVTDGATYAVHPTLTLAYADDMGFGMVPLRISWSVRTGAGALRCFVGLDGAGSALFTTAAGPTCPTISIFGVGAISPPGVSGAFDFTMRSVDMAGNLSAPVTRSYTVGS